MQKERMLDKTVTPDEAAINEYLGRQSFERLSRLEMYLRENYEFVKELKFPFGNNYGWCYKYNHKSSHLCYAFFEKGAFNVMLQIGDKLVPLMEDTLPTLLSKTKELWENRYPCGECGGWIHYSVETDEELSDVCRLISIKKKPVGSNTKK